MKHSFHLLAFVGFLLFTALLPAQAPFVTTWKTDNPGVSENNQIQIPGTGTNYNISWEEVGNPGNFGSEMGNNYTTLTFPSPGTYSVSITPGGGTFTRIAFQFQGDLSKILLINQWGDIPWNSMDNAFRGCYNLDCIAQDVPDLSGVSSMFSMFAQCYNLSGPLNIGDWNTENVTNMSSLFHDATSFNQDIGNWNTQNVQTTTWMFWNATSFNQDIGNWDTQNVKDMQGMFKQASSFNQNINGWNTSNVTEMWSLFDDASSFNQDIGNWDTQNVTGMAFMFAGASSFNQDISNWNTSKSTFMWGMFESASSFNQDLGDWHLNPVVDLRNMFENSGMDCTNYSATLKGWSDNPLTPNNRTLGASGVEYGNDVIDVRTHLINTKGWTITGDILLNEDCLMPSSIDDEHGIGNIRLWPNPALDHVYLNLPQDRMLTVFDLTGRRHLEMQLTSGETLLSLYSLTPGIYIFHFEQGERHLVVVQ